MPLKSQASLISSLPSYHSSELADRDALNSKTGLQSVDWLDAFRADPANEPVLTAGAMLSNNAKLPPDHIFSAFLKVGLLQDMLCTFNADKQEFSSLITLGKNVCGHPTIVHGGLTAAIVDETFGGLNYVMKKRGMLDPGPAFTVHMVTDWKKPIPAGSHIICTASLDSIEGRKSWVRATVKDRPDGVEYAAGKALFVIPKKHPLDKPTDGAEEQGRAHAAGKRAQTESAVEQQVD
ncbi:hypothetical protein WJX82_000211 [Trebouxia sp. C0006]